MNEPKRLLEEVDSPLARQLLNAGRWSPWPPGVRRQRVLTALGVGLAVGTTKKLSFAAMSTWSKVAVIGGVACAGAGGVVAYRAVVSDAAVVTMSAPHRASHPSEGSVVDDPDDDELIDVTGEPGALAVEHEAVDPVLATPEVDQSETARATSMRGVASQRGGANKAERKDSQVRAELTLLEHARGELRAGRSDAAVATLASYSQRFPKGILALEAEVLRIEALAAAGKTQEAARRAQRVLERHPNSVVASRLKRFEAPR